MGTIHKKDHLRGIATKLRDDLSPNDSHFLLLYAHNGIGKTRLSKVFKNLGKRNDTRDTLYFNAYTEDLFTWENDLENDREYYLKINSKSVFCKAFKELSIDDKVRNHYSKYTEIYPNFLYEKNEITQEDDWKVLFSKTDYRKIRGSFQEKIAENIKISRGEENIFIWCVFLAIVELAIAEDEAYNWVKYIYVDDPISSLDENNAIMIAADLANILKKSEGKIKCIISSHHTLFFNVMCHELSKVKKYFLNYHKKEKQYSLRITDDIPFFHHVAMIATIKKAIENDELYTYHFNILRTLLEKSANFHGFKQFSECLNLGQSDEEIALHSRYVNLLSHGGYSLFEPAVMLSENKEHFKNIFENFMQKYPFNPEIFEIEEVE